MAELASSMPTSGGLYYAAAVLAGPKYGPLAAWITGWSNWLVQVTGAPSVDYGCGEFKVHSARAETRVFCLGEGISLLKLTRSFDCYKLR